MKFSYKIMLSILIFVLSGCASIKTGELVPKSRFVDSDSVVKPLGMVKAEYSTWSFFIPPEFNLDKTYSLYDKVLAQKPGANILINYRLDNTYSAYFLPFLIPWYTLEVTLEGTAAKVEIGKKN